MAQNYRVNLGTRVDYSGDIDDSEMPKRPPSIANHLGRTEWFWSPANLRRDKYLIQSERSNWLLYMSYMCGMTGIEIDKFAAKKSVQIANFGFIGERNRLKRVIDWGLILPKKMISLNFGKRLDKKYKDSHSNDS